MDKPGSQGVYTSRCLSFGDGWEGPLGKCQSRQPDSGNLTVRDETGGLRKRAAWSDGHLPRCRKRRTQWKPVDLNRCAPQFYPNNEQYEQYEQYLQKLELGKEWKVKVAAGELSEMGAYPVCSAHCGYGRHQRHTRRNDAFGQWSLYCAGLRSCHRPALPSPQAQNAMPTGANEKNRRICCRRERLA